MITIPPRAFEDRTESETDCKADESEFSFDGMSADQHAARLAKMEAIKAEVWAKIQAVIK